MDLLNDETKLDLFDPQWRIYSVSPTRLPHFIANEAKVDCSLISEGAVIFGEVHNSVIFPGVRIEAGASVKDSVVMSHAVIQENARIERAVVCGRAIIQRGCEVVGTIDKVPTITVVEEKFTLVANSIVPAVKDNRSAG